LSLAYHSGSSSPSPSDAPVSFDATLSPDPGDGNIVTFKDNGVTIGTAATTNGVAVFTTSSLAYNSGIPHPITAVYGGIISSTISHTVNPPPVYSGYVISGSGSISAGVASQLTITAVDTNAATATDVIGDVTLVFSGLSAGPDSSLATVRDKNGILRALGSSTVITFTNGVGL